VLDQLEMLGALVVPVLRREFAAMRSPGIPDAPTHASLLAARRRAEADAAAGVPALASVADLPSTSAPVGSGAASAA
jgi:hypothetical protein